MAGERRIGGGEAAQPCIAIAGVEGVPGAAGIERLEDDRRRDDLPAREPAALGAELDHHFAATPRVPVRSNGIGIGMRVQFVRALWRKAG